MRAASSLPSIIADISIDMLSSIIILYSADNSLM